MVENKTNLQVKVDLDLSKSGFFVEGFTDYMLNTDPFGVDYSNF